MSSHPLLEAVGEPKPAGHTFGSFVEACRKLGVTDDMELGCVEYGIRQFGSGRLTVQVGPQGIEVIEI